MGVSLSSVAANLAFSPAADLPLSPGVIFPLSPGVILGAFFAASLRRSSGCLIRVDGGLLRFRMSLLVRRGRGFAIRRAGGSVRHGGAEEGGERRNK